MRFVVEYNPSFLNEEFIDWLLGHVKPELSGDDHEEYQFDVQDVINVMEDRESVINEFRIQFNGLEELKEDSVDYFQIDLETLKNNGEYVDKE